MIGPSMVLAVRACCGLSGSGWSGIGVAMVVAAATPNPRTVVLIVAYALASAVVIIPYMKWRSRVVPAAPGSTR